MTRDQLLPWAMLAIGLLVVPTTRAFDVDPTVARAQFTSNVVAREPVDAVTRLANDSHKVFFFTELRGMEGTTVVHRWSYGEQVMAEVPFRVGGNRWRVWSSKTLRADWLGEWTVSVVDTTGTVLAERDLTYNSTSARSEWAGANARP